MREAIVCMRGCIVRNHLILLPDLVIKYYCLRFVGDSVLEHLCFVQSDAFAKCYTDKIALL